MHIHIPQAFEAVLKEILCNFGFWYIELYGTWNEYLIQL